MDEPAPLPDDAPPAPTRRRITIALAAALTAQLIVPLTYYVRDDRYDERFAWRMFSAVRVERCTASASEVRDGGAQPIDLARAVHAAWTQHMERRRRAVIDRFLARRCELGAERAEVVDACTDAEGAPMPDVRYVRDCAEGDVIVVSR